jgi:hypothetical protein
MKSKKELIIRNISNASRMIEIINSMREPIVSLKEDSKSWIPKMTITAINKDGVCKYIYKSAGLMDIATDKKLFMTKLQKLLNPNNIEKQ